MYKVALSDDVLAAVQLHHLGAYSLAWLDGLLKDQHETGRWWGHMMTRNYMYISQGHRSMLIRWTKACTWL